LTLLYDESETFKIHDAATYDAVAAQFESFTQILTLPFVERLIGLAKLRASERVLDVGTGTGIVALNLAPNLPNGKVFAVDLSEGMLATAQRKAQAIGLLGRVEFQRMDAEALALSDQSFDVVLSLFAVLHFPNPLRALAEMSRVLRTGGRLIIAVGSRPQIMSKAGLIQGLRHIDHLRLKWLGKRLIAPVFLDDLIRRYLPASSVPEESALAHGGLNRTSGLLAVVRQAGFTRIRTFWYGHQVVLKTAEDFWAIQSTFSTFARKRLAGASKKQVEALRKRFFAGCEQVQGKGGLLIYPMGAFFITAENRSR
jgi:ubiquinone/menaquinone biosynthesis C-methylase UbiE